MAREHKRERKNTRNTSVSATTFGNAIRVNFLTTCSNTYMRHYFKQRIDVNQPADVNHQHNPYIYARLTCGQGGRRRNRTNRCLQIRRSGHAWSHYLSSSTWVGYTSEYEWCEWHKQIGDNVNADDNFDNSRRVALCLWVAYWQRTDEQEWVYGRRQ